jgi:hypothetical protein
MRKIACFLLLALGAATLPAAETWRWRDANGVIHFSDRPVPGAERVELGSAPRPGSTTPEGRTTTTQSRPQAEEEPAIVPYVRCVLVAPVNDQVLQNETSVQVALDLQPALQGNHRVQLLLNGQAEPNWGMTSTQGTLADLVRGSHTVVGQVVDEFGRPLCTSPAVTFHVRLPQVRPPTPTPR